MTNTVRNTGFAPDLKLEGTLVKPLKIPSNYVNNRHWSENISAFDRLHYHQTLASVRRYTHFKPLLGLIPEHELDFLLAAEYDHGKDLFAEKMDVVMQGYTIGTDNRRKMKNSYEAAVAMDAVTLAANKALMEGSTKEKKPKKLVKYNEYHVVHIGGITESRHPSNVKLMNSSHHSPQTNAGYTRQDSDGNAYQY